MPFKVPSIRSPKGFSGASGVSTGSVRIAVRTDMFFDRQAIRDATRYMNFHGLSRGSLVVRRIAQKSIKQRGAARPKPKIMTPGVSINALLARPDLAPRTRGALVKRLKEIQTPQGSPAGTPPFTHVPSTHMLGFRRNMYNGFDSQTQSAVAGPMQKGERWILPARHELGLPVTLRAWFFLGKGRGGIVKWLDESVIDTYPGWTPTSKRKRIAYPKRPFMRPALERAASSGKLRQAFRNSFGPFRGAGGDYSGGWG